MKKFAESLTNSQMNLARRFQNAGLTTISQAVKAFERHDGAQINEWKEKLRKIDAENGREWK